MTTVSEKMPVSAELWPLIAPPVDQPQQALGVTWNDTGTPPATVTVDGRVYAAEWRAAPGTAPLAVVMIPLVVKSCRLVLCAGSHSVDMEAEPPHRWDLYVVPHSHVDIGYTQFPDVLADEHGDYIAQALDLMRERDGDMTKEHRETATRTRDDTYWFGAHVYRAPCYDLNAVIADMATMRDMGMNVANIQTHWSWDNPQPGVFDFAETDRLVAAARECGLKVSCEHCVDSMKMLDRLIRSAGIKWDRQGTVARWRRRSGHGELWSLVNTGNGPCGWTADEVVEDLLSGRRFRAGTRLTIPGSDIRQVVPLS